MYFPFNVHLIAFDNLIFKTCSNLIAATKFEKFKTQIRIDLFLVTYKDYFGRFFPCHKLLIASDKTAVFVELRFLNFHYFSRML